MLTASNLDNYAICEPKFSVMYTRRKNKKPPRTGSALRRDWGYMPTKAERKLLLRVYKRYEWRREYSLEFSYRLRGGGMPLFLRHNDVTEFVRQIRTCKTGLMKGGCSLGH